VLNNQKEVWMIEEKGCATRVGETATTRRELAPAHEHYECQIRKVANGFVLRFGCKEFVAKNWEEASAGIGEYWKHPHEAQKKYTNS
jgi:hypothetical protein